MILSYTKIMSDNSFAKSMGHLGVALGTCSIAKSHYDLSWEKSLLVGVSSFAITQTIGYLIGKHREDRTELDNSESESKVQSWQEKEMMRKTNSKPIGLAV